MKSVLLPFTFLLSSFSAFAQYPSDHISLLSNWNPDSITQYNDIWGYMDCNGNEYSILGSKYKVHFMDLSNPQNPLEVANFSGGQGTTWRDLKTFRNRAYAVSDNTTEGLMIFDLSNLPQSVEKTYHSNQLFNNAHNIFIDEQNARMYVVGSSQGNLLIFDLAEDPDNPSLLVNANVEGGYAHDIYVRDHIAYLSHLTNGLYIYDCSDPQNIQVLGSTGDYLGTVFNHSSWLSEDGNTLIFCDETHAAKVKVADVSNPADIMVPAEYMFYSELEAPDASNSIAHNVLIREHYAFISYYHDGVQVFDISDPTSVQRVAYFDTYPTNTNYNGYQGCWGVYPFLSSGTIIASDISNGLFVLQLDDLTLQPTIDEIMPNTDLDIVNGTIICEGDSALIRVPHEP
ncbi:MAG TPA: choice-of-anchor B family protein, partial [Phaeodactylibacter sp.]|nr:choice-of-anchor B family protein [Phaeodactylibacter sp.]